MRSCIVCGKTEQQEEDQQEAEGYDREGFSSKTQGEPWCSDCHLFYNEHRQHFHPIDIVGHQPLAGGRLGIAPLHRTLPAYMEWAANWPKIGFDVDKMRRMMQGQPTTTAPQGGTVTQPQQHTMTITEAARITWQLQYGVGADGGTLSDEERAQLTARKAELEREEAAKAATTSPERAEALSAAAQVSPEVAADLDEVAGPPSILDQIKAQEAAQTADPSLMQQAEAVVDDYMQEKGIGQVTVEETGEKISFVEAAGRVHGLSPDEIAHLEQMRQTAHQPPPVQQAPVQHPHLTGPPPAGVTMGPASPPLGGSITPEEAVEAVMEVLQEANDPQVIRDLFLGLLEAQDPADSEITLAMFQHLQNVGRVHKMGTLDQPLSGYIYFYQEPKGTSKEGYTPGGTQGGRMVDKAKEQIEASGVQPTTKGMCAKCMKTVRQEADGSIVTDVDDDPACAGGGDHTMV